MFSTDRLLQTSRVHGRATKRRTYDRNVRLSFVVDHDVDHQDDVSGLGENSRRSKPCSKRMPVPVERYNVGEVTCALCGKNVRTLSLHHYTGAIVCSFDCFKKNQAQSRITRGSSKDSQHQE